MPAQYIAPRHIGHGSQEEYMTQPLRSCVPRAAAAILIACTSACAVGSCPVTTLLPAREIMFPLLTMTAPKGPPCSFMLSEAVSIASFRNFLSSELSSMLIFKHK